MEKTTLFAKFGNDEQWGFIGNGCWALWKSDDGKWYLDSGKGIHQPISDLAAKLLLEQYDLETENLPES